MTSQTTATSVPELLARLSGAVPAAQNSDFLERAVALPEDAEWVDTSVPNLQLRLLELVPASAAKNTRLTALLRLSGSTSVAELDTTGCELLLLKGLIENPLASFNAGHYFRHPNGETLSTPIIKLSADKENDALSNNEGSVLVSAECYVSLGQLATSDTRVRTINGEDESLWLPGPVEGTEVLPLHLHDTSNAMLIRWYQEVAFRPKLDPLGEELLVLRGTLFDRHGEYHAGSWIRNPVLAWQSWAAAANTVVYYKNGHF